jgi:hypothetical protein
MSGARYETTRDKQAKGGAGARSLWGRGLGPGPIERGRLSGGAADPRSECPFGAERARSEPPCAEHCAQLPVGAAVSDLSVAAGCGNWAGSTWSPKGGRDRLVAGVVVSGRSSLW